MQPIIAVIFDFDDTLAPDSTSSFLERQGLDVKAFWKSVEPLLKSGWDPVPAYLYRMVEASNKNPGKRFTKTAFEAHGRTLKPFAGATTIFSRIQKHVASINQDAKVEFYVISSGIRVTIQASSVSERSKPASRERMKTSHFEERIALCAVETAQRRDESTQRELATFDNDLGGAWLVPPADCA